MEQIFKVGANVRIVPFDVFRKRLEEKGYKFVRNGTETNGIFTKDGATSLGTNRVGYQGGHTGTITRMVNISDGNVVHTIKITDGPYAKPYGDGFITEWLSPFTLQNFNILD
jgi:hypothetical protein